VSAWVVVDTKITNQEAYEEYKTLAGPMVAKYGGTYRARGGELDVVEDDLWSPTRMVIVEFPDIEAARLFAYSDDYAPIAAIRHANADCTVVIVDGVD
jgi:uncharacterized protein (DUF1330 family)